MNEPLCYNITQVQTIESKTMTVKELIQTAIDNLPEEQLDELYQLIKNFTASKNNLLGLFVTLYAKSTDKMPRQHTSNPKIPKVSQAIASPFY